MKYTVKEHGDRLEKTAAEFITNYIPSYELIWQIFIGHKGNGIIADMLNINTEDNITRVRFAQHHYTILESLYLMHLIAEDESIVKPIVSFEEYRKTLNQIMAFQAYSGRLRDNLEECFTLIGVADEAKEATNKLEEFYQQRHVFIHGSKVPFSLDVDNLFMTAKVRSDKSSNVGYSKEVPWYNITQEEMEHLEDYLKQSVNNLTQSVNQLLFTLLGFVKQFIKNRSLEIKEPHLNEYIEMPISSSIVDMRYTCANRMEISGSPFYNPSSSK